MRNRKGFMVERLDKYIVLFRNLRSNVSWERISNVNYVRKLGSNRRTKEDVIQDREILWPQIIQITLVYSNLDDLDLIIWQR